MSIGRRMHYHRNHLFSKDGFALPSVLFIVTILSIVILYIISSGYFRNKRILNDIADWKSENAAKNGVYLSLAKPEVNNSAALQFEDGSSVVLRKSPWGVYALVESEGKYLQKSKSYSALIAQKMSDAFLPALSFTNNDHQLIFAGTADITGNILVGPQGTTVGLLPNVSSPKNLPVNGKVTKNSSFINSNFDYSSIKDQVDEIDDLIKEAKSGTAKARRVHFKTSSSNQTIDLTPFNSDSTEEVLISGNSIISGKLFRRGPPLTIVVAGNLTISGEASLWGLIRIISTDSIFIPSAATIDQCIIFSRKRIDIAPFTKISGQFISPDIFIHNSAQLRYPSVIFSIPDYSSKQQRTIWLDENVNMIGSIILKELDGESDREDQIILQASSKLIGTIYNEGKTTLDGTVEGSVITHDFYFYESPTKYYGWLRKGSINREILSKKFLSPMGFGDQQKSDVLLWF